MDERDSKVPEGGEPVTLANLDAILAARRPADPEPEAAPPADGASHGEGAPTPDDAVPTDQPPAPPPTPTPPTGAPKPPQDSAVASADAGSGEPAAQPPEGGEPASGADAAGPTKAGGVQPPAGGESAVSGASTPHGASTPQGAQTPTGGAPAAGAGGQTNAGGAQPPAGGEPAASGAPTPQGVQTPAGGGPPVSGAQAAKPAAGAAPERSSIKPPRWAEVEATDPGGAVPAVEATNQPTIGVPVSPPGQIGAPIRPAAPAPRPEVNRVAAVQAAPAAAQPAEPAERADSLVLTIPWPQVPASDDADPRRRIPIGAILTGILGEILITVGVILGLYVVWEIVWSSVEARPEQAHALEIVHERAAYVEPVTVEQIGPSEAPVFAPEYTDNFPTITGPINSEPWLSLHVPRWSYDYNVAIAEGVEDPVINRGLIGHYPDTQNPGEMGNFATAAHRITHGEPFARIQELHNGDELIVETDEYYLVYEMYDQRIVEPTDISVIWPVPGQAGVAPERRLITLTTCHPRYTSTHRYIVWGELRYWTKKSEGPLRALTPPALRGEGG